MLMISGCHSDNKNYLSLKNKFRSPEDLVLDSFNKYVHAISSPDFPLASFKSNTGLYKKTVYTRKIQHEKNLQFFPAILWQIYAINGKTKWKHIAENYTSVLYQDHIMENLSCDEAILYVYLAHYVADPGLENKASLLNGLSQYIAKHEANKDLNCDSQTNGILCIERLLENHLLFFASKETGDPVYIRLAQKNSELIYNHYFQREHSNELYHELASGKAIPAPDMLRNLSSEDLYHLAIIFYGFTILDKQQKNERYHVLCVRLANLFASILRDIDVEYTIAKTQKDSIREKVDILSKTLICLALNNLHDKAENHYQEIAEKTFYQILVQLNQPDEDQIGQYSSRLYYYLFEFFKQNDNL